MLNATNEFGELDFDPSPCCPRCGETLPGDTDVIVNGERICSDCGPRDPIVESSFEIVGGVVTELDCPAPRSDWRMA